MNVIPLKVWDKLEKDNQFFLPTQNGRPVELGTGRNAVVFLGQTAESDTATGNEYLAVKFLKRDIDEQYAQIVAQRFFKEAEEIRKFGQQQDYFVRYEGLGVIGSLEAWDAKMPVRDSLINNENVHQKLMDSYTLHGPFFVVELCQGTLYDVLEREKPWNIATKSYGAIAKYGETLDQQFELSKASFESVKKGFMRADNLDKPMSGYDILNSFVANEVGTQVRNYAVLELFKTIVETVFQVHEAEIVHRDLKPGNLFIRHGVGKKGFRDIDFKLADLGYVADIQQLTQGDMTLEVQGGYRSTSVSVPGSLFYRAPEQMELPVEVRLDIDAQHRNKVHVKASKLISIDKGDWLIIGDMFKDFNSDEPNKSLYFEQDKRNQGIFKIENVEKPTKQTFLLTLNAEGGIPVNKTTDLQAHIIKLTGFHTDGFSLGAILYDLASGGKNPEAFYTYCLTRFHRALGQIDYSIENVMNVLAPETPNLSSDNGQFIKQEHELKIGQKVKLANDLRKSSNLDDLIQGILTTILEGDFNQENLDEALDNYRFRNFPLVKDLLEDRRGVAIPADILEIIVKCMLRDVEGSYYNSDDDDGFLSGRNIKAVHQLRNDVENLLGQGRNRFPADFPESFQNNLLIKLKMFWQVEANPLDNSTLAETVAIHPTEVI